MKLASLLARAVALTTLASAASLCLAQGASAPAPASSPAKKALVDKALQLQQPGLENLANSLAGQPAQQLLQAASRAVGQLPADKRELVGNEIQAEVRKFYDDVSPVLRASAIKLAPSTVGASLDASFTEEELKTLVAWLESPVSKKLSQVAMDGQQALTQKLVAETRGSIEPKLKALEQSVAKKLGLPNAPATASNGGNAAAPAAKASGTKK
jgi:hypothetical protein